MHTHTRYVVHVTHREKECASHNQDRKRNDKCTVCLLTKLNPNQQIIFLDTATFICTSYEQRSTRHPLNERISPVSKHETTVPQFTAAVKHQTQTLRNKTGN